MPPLSHARSTPRPVCPSPLFVAWMVAALSLFALSTPVAGAAPTDNNGPETGSADEQEPFYPSRGEEPRIDLALRLKPGMVFHQGVITQQHITQEHEGRQVESILHSNVQGRHEVRHLDADGRVTIAMTYHRLVLRLAGLPGRSIELSSDVEPAAGDPRGLVHAMLDRPVTYTLDPDGALIAIEGFDALLSRVRDAVNVENMPHAEAWVDLLERHFGEPALRRQIEHLRLLPQESIGLGARWRHRQQQHLPAPMFGEHRFELQRVEETEARIAIHSRMSTTGRFPKPQPPAAAPHDEPRPRLVMGGTQQGYCRLNRATGLPLRIELTAALDGHIELPAPQAGADHQPNGQSRVISHLTLHGRTILTTQIEPPAAPED